MYLSTYRNLGQRQAVTYSDLGLCTVHNLHSVGQTFGSEDIGLGTVFVADQRDVCCSVRIVLDTDYGCRNAILVSLEINYSVFSSGTAAAMSYSDLTLIVTAGVLLQGNTQALLVLEVM